MTPARRLAQLETEVAALVAERAPPAGEGVRFTPEDRAYALHDLAHSAIRRLPPTHPDRNRLRDAWEAADPIIEARRHDREFDSWEWPIVNQAIAESSAIVAEWRNRS